MSSEIASPRKSARKKRKLGTLPNSDVAPLYREDLGMDGIKQKRDGWTQSPASFELPLTSEEKRRREDRKARFVNSDHPETSAESKPLTSKRKTRQLGSTPSTKQFVGHSTNLEKPFLRLTTFPKAEDVRPLKVLKKALAHIKSRYIQEEDFEWANEQLKSVRQDLTVQRIRNQFALDVYETHARMLLEYGDLDEFNQCQTVIRTLTEGPDPSGNAEQLDQVEGNIDISEDGDFTILKQSDEHLDEFRGYNFLYALVRNSAVDLKLHLVRTGVGFEVGELTSDVKKSGCRHALRVVKAVMENDYRTFFRLYESPPHMSAYLMDFLVKRVRENAFDRIIAAYRPNVSMEIVRKWLNFQDIEETRRFLRQKGAVFVQEHGQAPFWVDCKATVAASHAAKKR